MKYYIGVDLGTSAMKLLLTDREGRIIGEVSKEYEVYFPKVAWSEQNPEDWWQAFLSGTKELIKDIDAKDIAGIGVAGQMHGLVALDHNDNVIRPAILWNDSRTEKEVEYLNNEIGKSKLSDLTANIAFAGFTAPKLLWMRKNEPENFKRIAKIMLPKDYLNYRLTGEHTTDFSDASGMLLLDVKNKCWSKEMLDICDISIGQLPRLAESYDVIGKVLPEIAKELGFSGDVKVVAGAGDNAAAAIGTGTVADGGCNISLGTSGTVFIPSDKFSVDSLNALHSFCHANGKYHLMACILSAASCNKWFCEEILKTADYQEEQSKITDDMLGSNSVCFLPYLMGERSPINDTDARGMFIGLHMNTSREDMVLSVLEGVSFAIRDNIEIARSQGININTSSICGGGAKSKLWQKIICNILNIELTVPITEQGPGYGGAMLSMVGAGEYSSVRECADNLVKIKERISPDPAIVERYNEKYEKFKKIYPSVKELYKELK